MGRNKKFTKEQEVQVAEDYKSGLSSIKLARVNNCSQWTICNILERHNIMRRSVGAAKGKNHPMFGVHRFGKDAPNYGNHHTEKAKQKIRKRMKGKNNPNFGKHFHRSPEAIQKMRDKKKGIKRKPFSELTRQKLSKANSTPENIQITLRNNFGTKCYYNGEFFPSLQERNCYIYLNQLNYLVIHNWLGRFDFLVNGKIVVEFHPFFKNTGCDRNSLTDKQYYDQRRKLLDEKGYANLKLVVIKDLKEIENLEKEI